MPIERFTKDVEGMAKKLGTDFGSGAGEPSGTGTGNGGIQLGD